MSKPSSAELDALIEELTIDCYNDEEQLTGLLTGAEEALVVGEIATIAGTEIRIVAIDCPTDIRRGLTPLASGTGSALNSRSPTFGSQMTPSSGT